ncbi:MAG: DUF5596 domain-containing protein [Clostridia bacterium]|nr:DUF5596 domain-containing protein [Clostridia bacterium]
MKNSYRKDFEDFMRFIDFHEDAIEAQLEAFDKVFANDKCRAYLTAIVDRYRDTHELEFGMLVNDAVLSARELKDKEYDFILLFNLCTAMYSYPVYEAKGLSRKVWHDTMEDYRFKLNECRRMYGEWGTFVNWFGRFFTADCITFNRLEFELESAAEDLATDELTVRKGQLVVNVHIPSNEKIPLSKEECDKSYHLAAEYFAPYFGDEPIIFMCGSWLLHEAMKDFLPEDSNILRFASEYVIASRWDSTEDLWRIFYIKDYDGNPENLPEETSLQRGYKKHLMDEKMPGAALGYRKHVKKSDQ